MLSSLILSLAMSTSPAPVIENDSLDIVQTGRKKIRISHQLKVEKTGRKKIRINQKKLKYPFYNAIGNHDISNKYREFFNLSYKYYHDFVKGNNAFILASQSSFSAASARS